MIQMAYGSVLWIVVMATFTLADKFSELWYDGNAEISTYRTREMQYGEPRDGVRIMIFVTEPMRLSTYIKPDSTLPDSLQVRVIKLNDLRKFSTGIYSYSVMTSVFSSVESSRAYPMGTDMKVAFTSQEWCGTVFERTIRAFDSYDGVLYSYFESEGERQFSIPADSSVVTEEGLWIRIRELRGHRRRAEQVQQVRVIPSTWSRRKTRQPPRLLDATLRKGDTKRLSSALGMIDATEFSWTIKDQKTRVWVETAYPHRILAWEENDGSSGVLLASRREPYWKQKSNTDERLRRALKLKADTKAFRWPWEASDSSYLNAVP